MVCYGMVCYGLPWWMRICEIVCFCMIFQWYCMRFHAMLWNFNSMLCYVICCKRSVWSDCTFFSKTITFLNKYHLHKIKVLTWDGDSRATSMTSLRIYYFCFLEQSFFSALTLDFINALLKLLPLCNFLFSHISKTI